MTYFNTSTQTPNERRNEADKILELLADVHDALTEVEKNLVTRLMCQSEPVSPKQLFWLRDIKDKYL